MAGSITIGLSEPSACAKSHAHQENALPSMKQVCSFTRSVCSLGTLEPVLVDKDFHAAIMRSQEIGSRYSESAGSPGTIFKVRRKNSQTYKQVY